LAVDIFAPGVIQAPKLELRNMRYGLSDFEWSVIKPMLPNKPRGMPRVDDRRVLNGIFWLLRSGAPWRDLPGIYGPCTTCYNRFVRWRRAGVWDRIMEALAAAHDAAVQMIDTSVVRVHQHGACIAGNRGALVNQQGAWVNIPPKLNRKDPICFSPHLYRARNLVERFFNRIKQCRRIATRYDKLAANYLAFIKLASIRLWLRAYESTP
jgi:transposase